MSQPSAASNSKYLDALHRLKQRLTRGEWAPGERLPTRAQLQQSFGLSHSTMQRVLNRLAREGFIATRTSQGTFVAEHPPHLTDFALLFHESPHNDHPDSRYFQALLKVADAWGQEEPIRFHPYYGLNGRRDAEDYDRLISDLRERRLAGLIVPQGLAWMRQTDALSMPGAYHVGILDRAAAEPGPAVHLDSVSFFERSVSHLAERGRRRLACLRIAHPFRGPDYRDELIAATAQRHGLHCPEHWRLFVQPHIEVTTRRCVRLLMDRPEDERPDALLVTDDHLLDPALSTLLADALVPGQQLDVVSLANFPAGPAPVVPVTRIGFDVAAALRACVKILRDQRSGVEPQSVTIPAISEAEYHANRNAHAGAPDPRS